MASIVERAERIKPRRGPWLRLPAALPQLSGWRYPAFKLIWFAAFALAVIAPVAGTYLEWKEDYVDSSLSTKAVALFHLVLGLMPGLVLVPAAALIFLRRRRDNVAALLSLSLLMIGGSFMNGATFLLGPLDAPLLLRVARAGWAGLAIVLLVFPDGRFGSRWTSAFSFVVVAWTAAHIYGSVPLRWQQAATVVFVVAGVTAAAARYRRLPLDMKREQIRWALFGFAAGAVLLTAALTLRFLVEIYTGPDQRWRVWGDLAISATLTMSVVCFGLGLMVSILRYRLYDAEAVISRSAGYAVLTVLLAAAFGAIAKGLEVFFETYFGQDAGALPGVIGAGVAVALITPLNNRIQGWAERRFQKGLAHLRRDLPECMSDLRETAPLHALAPELLDRVAQGVRASHAALIIGDSLAATRDIEAEAVEAWRQRHSPDARVESLDCYRDDPLFPIRLPLRVRYGRGAPVGWVLLGPRPDGSFYGKDERDSLAEIADPVARAVQVVLLREEREARHEVRFAAIERKLARALKGLGGGQSSG